MNVKEYSSSDEKEWDAFVDLSKNGFFMFKRGYMDYHNDRFRDSSLMLYDNKGNLSALLPANLSDGVLYSHQGLSFGGVLATNDMRAARMLEVFTAIEKFCLEKGIGKFVYKEIPHIYHSQPSEEESYALYRNSFDCFRVDISSTINQTNPVKFASLRRRSVKKAKKLGVAVNLSEDFSGFYKVLSFVLSKYHGVEPVHTLDELILLHSRFPNNIKLYTASNSDGETLAGVIIYETSEVAHAQYTVANDEGRAVGALDLIIDQLVSTVYVDKKYFDLGISTERQGAYLNEGLIAQKEGFGARGIVFRQFMKTINLEVKDAI